MSLRNNYLKTILIALSALLIIAKPSFAINRIIAIVNDELITQSDLEEYIQSSYAGVLSHGGYSEEELEKIRLDLEINGIHNLIEDKLILSKAKEKDLQVNERLVDERIDEIKARYPDEQSFLDALTKSGVSITDIRSKIRDQLMIKYIVSNDVRSKIFVNPQEVTKFYEDHIDDFRKTERVNLESIFIPFDGDRETAQLKVQTALKKINEGENFDQVKRDFSAGSSLGIVERGQLMGKIEDVIFNLSVNEVSEAVEVDAGIYIFKLTEKLPAETAPLDEVKDRIYNLLFNQKFEKLFNQWTDELKKNAYIEIKD